MSRISTCLTYFLFLSFDAKLINVSHSGGNVTPWTTVVMGLMNLMTVVSTSENVGI